MKVVMISFYTGPKGVPDLKPGDVATFEDDEAARLISVGGARAQTADEVEAAAKTAADAAVAAEAKAKADADAKANAGNKK